ncbi:MAG: glycosyltransferase family 4 protein [Coriobacteriia bacterium]|nr:glycosyltransferase family 4 protein [Coriobacteriia bacterium]MCL2870626.1 glycosyltransferase family 4 protein [Coriobacteriia bacterium]
MQSKTYTAYFALDGFLGLFGDTRGHWAIGGAEIQMYYLASALADMPNVSVVLLHSDKASVPTISHPHITTVQYRKPIEQGLPLLSRHINQGIIQSQFGFQSDASFFVASNDEPLWLLNEAKAQGIPVLYWVNGNSLVDGSELLPEEALLYKDVYIDIADGIVAQNSLQKKALSERYGRDSKIIPNTFRSDVLETVDEKDIRPIPNSLLWAGRVDPVKRPWIIEELSRRLPETTIICALHDRGDSGLFREIMHDLKDKTNVNIHISLEPEKLRELYLQVDAVINTSSTEGFPNTLTEAALASKPYLSLEFDLDGLLTDGFMGRCAKGCGETFIKQIIEILNAEEERSRIGLRSKEFVKKEWNDKVVGSKFLAYADELLR